MAHDPKDVPAFPTVCLIGPTGVGKSSLGNVLVGTKDIFKVEHSAKVGTLKTQSKTGKLCGKDIQVVDTIGLESNAQDTARVRDVIQAIRDIKATSVIAIVVNATQPRVKPFIPIIDKYNNNVNEDFLNNHLVIIFTHWPLDKKSVKARGKKGITEKTVRDSFLAELNKEYPNVKSFSKCDKIPCYFIDCDEAEDDDDKEIQAQHMKQLKEFYQTAKLYPTLNISIKQIVVNNVSNNNNNNSNNNSNNSSKKDGTCISNYEKVDIICHKTNTMKQCLLMDVKVNDLIKSKNGFEKVVYVYAGFLLPNGKNCCKDKPCLRVCHENGTITLTRHHLIYVKNETEPVLAGSLKIGDYLDCGNNKYSKIGSIEATIVDTRSIITQSGEFFASGIRISSYSHTTKLHYLKALLPLVSIAPKMAQKVEKELVLAVIKHYIKEN